MFLKELCDVECKRRAGGRLLRARGPATANAGPRKYSNSTRRSQNDVSIRINELDPSMNGITGTI